MNIIEDWTFSMQELTLFTATRIKPKAIAQKMGCSDLSGCNDSAFGHCSFGKAAIEVDRSKIY